jgi:hypothetical protein
VSVDGSRAVRPRDVCVVCEPLELAAESVSNFRTF